MALPDEKPSEPSSGSGPEYGNASVGVEIAFVLGLIALIGAICWQALSLPIFAVDGTVGPGLFPIPISFGLLAGLIVYVFAIGGKLLSARQDIRAPASHPPVFDLRQVAILLLVAGAVLAGSTIGLFATVGLLLLIGLLTVEGLKPLETVGFTIGALIVFYLIFDAWLHMNIGLNDIL
jgi:hypothetical protein